MGERFWGGYSERQRVRSEFVVRRPAGMSSLDAMAIGTAGLTAMLCVAAIEDAGVTPADGPVIVTGAAGGVGSMSVALLARLGFEVAAVTGRPETQSYLGELGASRFLTREEMNEPARPMETETWAAAVDTVGSAILAKVHQPDEVPRRGHRLRTRRRCRSADDRAAVHPARRAPDRGRRR